VSIESPCNSAIIMAAASASPAPVASTTRAGSAGLCSPRPASA
jgi:hypothetical protein